LRGKKKVRIGNSGGRVRGGLQKKGLKDSLGGLYSLRGTKVGGKPKRGLWRNGKDQENLEGKAKKPSKPFMQPIMGRTYQGYGGERITKREAIQASTSRVVHREGDKRRCEKRYQGCSTKTYEFVCPSKEEGSTKTGRWGGCRTL